MYVQIITLQAPLGRITQLRDLVASEYLPALQNRSGFISAHLLEQVDNRDAAQLVVFWDHQSSADASANTGVLAGTETSIAARIPGLRVQRQSYIIKIQSTAYAATAI